MPMTHNRTFRVRHYETDGHGLLNNANYLRYMQETAFDASAAAGYDLDRYNQMKRLWLIRESGIEFLCPLYYNDYVEIKTWVADFRRISSRRSYEFHNLDSGDLVAQAYTDWVFLDTRKNRPAVIPDTVANDFYPEGLPETFPPRKAFPKPVVQPPEIYKMQYRVAWNDIDIMQHVNNAVYLDYVTECGMQVIAAFGWPWERMANQGFGIYLRRIQIQYIEPALLNDELEVATWTSNIRRATAIRHYTIQRVSDGRLLAQAQAFSVWVSLATGKPIRIPRDFLADFADNITPET